MADYPPPPGAPYVNDPRYQKRVLREQARVQRDMIRAQREMYKAQVRGLRRSSLAGPLLVIGIGVLFLLVQLGRLPAAHLWTWYGRWWPFLLIAIGVVRLAEWAFDQTAQSGVGPPTTRPRRVLGGGVVLLVALLSAGGLLLTAAHNQGQQWLGHGFNINQDNIDEFLGDRHESDETVTRSCPENASVSIDNPRGDVSVSGTSDDGLIHISAHKQVYTRTDSEAETKAAHLSPRIETTGSAFVITMPSIEGARADLTITVPGTTTLTLNTNRGDARVNSVRAAVSVTANHGDVNLSAIHGTISAHINNGDSSFSAHSITGATAVQGRGRDLTLSDLSGPVSLSGEFFGTTHLERVRGAIRFHTSRTDLQLARLDGEIEISPNADLSADQLAGPVTLNTRNRNITLERVTGDLAVTNHNGSVDLTVAPPAGNITVENRNGSVNVTMPNDAGFVVQAETTNGDVEDEFSLPKGGGENHSTLSGSVNQGGPLVRITTSQGDINLKKGSVAPLSTVPPLPPKLTSSPADPRGAMKEAEAQARQSAREAAQQLRAAQEQVRSANRDATETQREAERKLAEAQREVDRASKKATTAPNDEQ